MQETANYKLKVGVVGVGALAATMPVFIISAKTPK